MPRRIKLIPRSDWDFSSLVGSSLNKGEKRSREFKRIHERDVLNQSDALCWELSRENGSKQTAWLKLKNNERRPAIKFEPISEISHSDFARFISVFSGEPADLTLWDPYGPAHPNPIHLGETPHILAIRWREFGIEEIIPALVEWARKAATAPGRKKRKSSDPMSDLWSLAAYRLHMAGHSYPDVARMLNALPKFKDKRGSFDADGARKSAAEGEELIRKAKPFQLWTECLTPLASDSLTERNQPD